MTLAVSVVVPTHRRAELLRGCLHALLQQTLAPSAHEILVVDDADDASTRRIVKEFAAQAGPSGPAVRYLCNDGASGPAASRNLGWRQARAPIVAFTDDDCLPDPDWLRAGLDAFRDDTAAVAGHIVVPLREPPTDYERNAARLSEATFATANCFCRRDVLERAGGFDERYQAAWREDSDLQFALEQEGLAISHAARAVVLHPVRSAPWCVSLHQQRKSMFNALLYKKFPDRYRAQIQAAPPVRYYATLGAILLALILPWRSRRMAVAPLLIWAALTAQFCATRLRGTSHRPSHLAEMAITSVAIPPLAICWRLRGAVKYRVVFF